MEETNRSMLAFLTWIKSRINSNKNAIIIVNGPTGSGKTYSCISLANATAKMLGSNFSVEENLEFKFNKLLELMELPQNQKAGTPFVFEEVGAFGGGASAREWQSKANKFFFSFMQTARHRNQVIFMNCPNFSFLEYGSRSLVHFQMQMAGIDFYKKVAKIKPYRVQVNARTGKFYFKYIRIKQNGVTFKLNKLEVPYPPKDMVKVYEGMKMKYTTALNEEIKAIEEDKKKKKEKANWKCNNCSHEWKPRSITPAYCPHCQKRDIYIVK